ncbi:MAG: hypothetical protein H7288_00475 [Kineosporiaceae bacterium]|nr:hypothetical protein [Aeromicrobium sp.]
MLKWRLWMLTLIVVGGWTGLGVYLMLQGAFELFVSGVVFVIVGLTWAWFQLWLPKAVLTSSELQVMNRLRTHRIALEDINGTVERAPLVTFKLNDGRRIPVSAINGWYIGQKWNPALANHAARFVEAVFAAKEVKLQSRD